MTSSAALQEVPSASFFSSSTRRWTHDVFLSFRSKDTRNNFTSHLQNALHKRGINAYVDEELRKGEKISLEILKAIEESRICIVVLYKHYASSIWCLEELVKILECKETKRLTVLPVFYKINPSVIRNQEKSFGKSLAKLEDNFKDDMKLQRWKEVLKEVTNLAGWHLGGKRKESELIHEVVQVVSRIVNHTYLNVAKYPIGIESRIHDINAILSNETNDICMVGIFGIGGIGKTTIAKAIYNLIAYRFEGSCFLANIRENSKRECGLIQMQNTLLCEVLRDSNLKVVNTDQGIDMIRKRLCCNNVLLVLDDVDQLDQLETLAGGCDWFGIGSRIIITTRDKHLLTEHKVDLTYKAKKLDHNESLQLFSRHAFKSDNPDKPNDDFAELIEHALHYAGGLPIALTVLGSYLYGRDIHQWKGILEKYRISPPKNIQEILRISYDGLDENEKNIFLDIACFFKGGHVGYVISILESCSFFPKIGIKVLMDKSLITTDEFDILVMHDLIQDMGREIVRQEAPKEPGRRSRLWFHEDIRYVLEENMGTNKIEGILVELPKRDVIRLGSKAFKKMKRLRLFVNCNALLLGGPNYLSNELRLLDWSEYPLQSLPSNFSGKKLVALRIRSSFIKEVGEEFQNFQNLKIMDFSSCEFLTKIPDLSRTTQLEELTLHSCRNLVEVHHSVGFLIKLVRLNLTLCCNLRSLPRSLKLRSLEFLGLENCSSLEKFPEIECEMERLKFISFERTGIKEIPSSIGYLTGLRFLFLNGCKNLVHLPTSILRLQNLQNLYLRDCSKLVGFPKDSGISSGEGLLPPTSSDFFNDNCSSIAFPSLRFLDFKNCFLSKTNFLTSFNCSSTLRELSLSGSDIVILPQSIKRFVGLRSLQLLGCKKLQKIVELPPNIHEVFTSRCISLESFPEVSRKFQFITCNLPSLEWIDLCECHKLLVNLENPLFGEGHHENLTGGIVFPGDTMTEWFNHQKKTSNGISCEINIEGPLYLDENIGIALCAVIAPILARKHHHIRMEIIVDGISRHTIYRTSHEMGSVHVWLEYLFLKSSEVQGYVNLRVKFYSGSRSNPVVFKSCGVHLRRKHEENEDVDVHLDHEVDREIVDQVDLMEDIQLSKRRHVDDYSSLESNWYPQLKRRSSMVGIKISELEVGES
ncbi:hypothetical protein I3842_16G097800 [Carya illinoinensis]|uniref:TIR domain-containing protein n=1 Tax=Carya illinoinensis TaxID=32201 RepID=A0A922A193_CARIL|nr:hypothetical protein I3842_16G097800 [Carya illinoinensis]